MEMLIVLAILGAVVALIATMKGRGGLWWFVYGVLLFPVALVHVAVVRRRDRDSGEKGAPGQRSWRVRYARGIDGNESSTSLSTGLGCAMSPFRTLEPLPSTWHCMAPCCAGMTPGGGLTTPHRSKLPVYRPTAV